MKSFAFQPIAWVVFDGIGHSPRLARLDEFGYENSPLEKMSYDAEALFKQSSAIFGAEKFVAERLGSL